MIASAYQRGINSPDVRVRWLREKIEEDPTNPKLIQTVRGAGYYFRW